MEALVDNELLPRAVESELQPIENIQTEVGCVSLRGNDFDVFEDPPVVLEVNSMGFVEHSTTIIICDEDLAESSRAQVWDKSAGNDRHIGASIHSEFNAALAPVYWRNDVDRKNWSRAGRAGVTVFSKHAIQQSRTGSVNADYLLVVDRKVFVPVLP